MHVIWIYIIIRHISVTKQLKRGHKFSDLLDPKQNVGKSVFSHGRVFVAVFAIFMYGVAKVRQTVTR